MNSFLYKFIELTDKNIGSNTLICFYLSLPLKAPITSICFFSIIINSTKLISFSSPFINRSLKIIRVFYFSICCLITFFYIFQLCKQKDYPTGIFITISIITVISILGKIFIPNVFENKIIKNIIKLTIYALILILTRKEIMSIIRFLFKI